MIFILHSLQLLSYNSDARIKTPSKLGVVFVELTLLFNFSATIFAAYGDGIAARFPSCIFILCGDTFKENEHKYNCKRPALYVVLEV
jgi:hypothetical protein